MENGTEQNAGNPNPGSGADGSGGDPGTGGSPAGQGGTQIDPRDEQINTMRTQIKTLNQAVVDARRGAGGKGGNPNGQDPNAFETPEGQYAIALEVSENRLRGGLEPILGLYPEVPADEIARIRTNPWAFASRDSFLNGDQTSALLEIEQALLARAEAIAAEKSAGNPAPNGGQTATPANVNGNPAPEAAPSQDVVPGSEEDEDPWTMPMEKLELRKNQAVAKQSQPQS